MAWLGRTPPEPPDRLVVDPGQPADLPIRSSRQRRKEAANRGLLLGPGQRLGRRRRPSERVQEGELDRIDIRRRPDQPRRNRLQFQLSSGLDPMHAIADQPAPMPVRDQLGGGSAANPSSR